MKKILFITARNPYSGRYSGDVIRAKKIIDYLRTKNSVDAIFLTNKKEITKIKNDKKNIFFEYPNFIKKVFFCLSNLFKLKPLQFGLFYSEEMANYINENAKDYDLLFFHQIRSSQYLPKEFRGKTVLEMGDLYSDNYKQTFNNLNFFNIFRFVYLLESFLVKRVENLIFSSFDKIILFSKSEINKVEKKYKKKIYHIGESIQSINKKHKFSTKNNKVLFIGNLGYMPNILACKEFIKYILPILKKKIPNIEFNIIGNIKPFDKFFLSLNKNTKILGPQKKIDKFIDKSICGLANLKVATGVQGKVLTYMSYGLPVICSEKTSLNFDKNVLIYKNNNELINLIYNLKDSVKLHKKFSKNSLMFVKNLNWKKVSLNYSKIIKFNK